MKDGVPQIDPSRNFEKIAAEDRRRVVLAHAWPSMALFFPVVFYIGVMEWITRPGHRTAVLIVGSLYGLIGLTCFLLLRWRPQWAVGVAVGGVSAMCAAMLSYSPMVRGSGELCVLAVTILIGGFSVAFPLGLRNQLLASIVPLVGYATVLQLGTTTAYPLWYSASALVCFLFVVAAGAHAVDQYRARILEHAFRQTELAIENARLRDEARAADRAKTDLMSMLSHELRTSLGTIQLFSELLVEGSITKEEELPEIIGRIHGQSRRAIDLVHTMLEFGSAETGVLGIVVEEIDVAKLLEEIRADIPASWRLPNVELLWEGPGRGVVMRTDRGKVEAIVRNLIHNALRHTPRGRVQVAAAADPARDSIRFTVSDTGEGIPSEAMPRIFDRFARATSSGEGFGLGLYIVKRFADVLGGRVAVQSEPGVGTRFDVEIPRLAPSISSEPVRAVG
jgi:signal transduction histidine kinase